MKFLLLSLFSLLLTFGSDSADFRLNGDKQESNAINDRMKCNNVVDDFFDAIEGKLDEMFEPIPLPDVSFGFEQKILLVTVEGEAKLYNGRLDGFSSLRRSGDAQLDTSEKTGQKMLMAPLGVSNMKGHYSGHVKFMNVGPSIHVDVEVQSIMLEMYLAQNYKVIGEAAFLADLIFKHLGHIELKIHGLGPLDWIINPFSNFVLEHLKGFIFGLFRNPVKNWLADQIKLANIQL